MSHWKPTSQSRTVCPHCGRPPGGIHTEDVCPRSSEYRARLDVALYRPPRIIWPGKGPVHASVPRRARGLGRVLGMRKVDTFNPGVPYVKPGKPWTAGGLPTGMMIIGRNPDGSRAWGDRRALAHRFYADFIGVIRGEVQ